MKLENVDRAFMEKAIEEMQKGDAAVKVGAVLVVDGKVVSTGTKTQVSHAERDAIEKANAQGIDIKHATLYSTLEPCIEIKEKQKKQCCADLIVESGITTVFIGALDPHPSINQKGWRRLLDGGVKVRNFPQDLREQINQLNSTFIGYFSEKVGPSGGARINHRDRACFRLQFSESDARTMDIGWTVCGVNAAYGYALSPVEVAVVEYARNFDDIDDPTAHDFKNTVKIAVGQIGIFRGPDACVLMQPKEVASGPEYGTKDYFVNFDFEVRLTT